MEPNEIDPGEEPNDAADGEGLSKFWLAVLLLCFFTLVGLTTIGALMRVTSLESEVETRAMLQDAEPLCAAIDAYVTQYGRSPETLDSLVPDFVAQLPPLSPEEDPGFEYLAGEESLWTLTIWGGTYQYSRISSDETWYVTGDIDETYHRDDWRPFHWLLN